jgi:hypothetical protein
VVLSGSTATRPQTRSAAGVHPARPPEGDLFTFNQLAEYVIWALLQPPAVDTIIIPCFGAMI